MYRIGFTRRPASFLTAGLFAVIFAVFSLTAARAQQAVVHCVASAEALGGTYVTVNDDQAQVNVRGGPNSYLYGKVRILYTYESAPALGRSPGGDWIEISCPGVPGNAGWVYAANVTLTAPGELPVVEIPVTATPLFISTVDPILAADFPTPEPTKPRLPTFTPAVPQAPLDFADPTPAPLTGSSRGGLIIALAAFGLAVLIVSNFFRR